MADTATRYEVASIPEFQGRVLVLGVTLAQEYMNISDDPKDADLGKLKAKSQELLNSPDQFKERLALSVTALLPEEAFQFTGQNLVIEDEDLEIVIEDAFDGLAGVVTSPSG